MAAIIGKFGGAARLAEAWHESLRDAQRNGKDHIVLRHFREIAWLLRYRDEILRRHDAERSRSSDDELDCMDEKEIERETALLVKKWILANPVETQRVLANAEP